ncbi:uncharacterized protein [Scyliorhinus torazame]|uniref:uncharacterized protein n=1 Tax=Scyliorhinus torazame TaxID=75743 RepID=UPI003B5A1F6B
MDLLINPDRLQLSPHAANATSTFDHWLACSGAYLRAATEEPSDPQKLQVLNHRFFPLIWDAPPYSEAMTLLKGHYVKLVNQVYARRLLAMRRQLPRETLDDFLRALQILSRNCDCQAVSAVQHTELLIRDAYVTGMKSTYVCQRLLEGGTLDHAETRQLANSLEVNSRNLESYTPDRVAPSWASWTPPAADSSSPQACAAWQPANSGGPKCYFCGQSKHPRQRCPVRSAICNGCGKKGHFVSVCQARSVAAVSRPGISTAPRCVPGAPPTSPPQAMCGPWAPASSPLQATCGSWAPPSLMPPAKCASWAPPSSAPFWTAPQDPCSSGRLPPTATSATADQPGTSQHLPQLASITLDQSRPRNLATDTTTVKIDGHETTCPFDSGSTDSFIYPTTEIHLRGLAPNTADSSCTSTPPEACAEP